MHISNVCEHCLAQTRSRKRELSDQIWSVLIAWGEVDKSLVDNPICEDCYNEFREVLIDRAQELETALADPEKYHAAIQKEQAKAQKSSQVRKVHSKGGSTKRAETSAAAKKTAKKAANKSSSKKAKSSKKKSRKVGKLAS